MRFSVIIPAYNAEKTIGYCLESVINQDFPKDDYEIIVVDDCSPDNQSNIINRYSENYPPNTNNILKARVVRNQRFVHL